MRFILKNANNCMYYGGELNKSEVCEHVAFNECLVKNGARLFINPGMINTACRKGEHICSGLG